MSDKTKAEIRKWIEFANMAIYRGDAEKAYEALSQASYLAGTAVIEGKRNAAA